MFSLFNKCRNLVVALSEKRDGPMKLFGDSFRDKIIIENREKFLNKLGINADLLVKADLVHGNRVKIVSNQEEKKTIGETDGLITGDKNLFLSITVADCLPIYLYDCKKGVVGLIHGGWRSLVQNILGSAIKKLIKDFESSPENILVGIGPGISKCHFEIKENVLDEFKSFPSDVLIKEKRKIFVDLKKIAKIQLINSGLKRENIEVNPDCTYCLSDKYFSFRRSMSSHHSIGSESGADPPETMMAVIGMSPGSF